MAPERRGGPGRRRDEVGRPSAGHGAARPPAARTETPEGTDCQTGSIVEATSLDVIAAGQLPDRRSRRGRALRLVRPDRRRCAGHPSPRLSVCVGPFGQDEPYARAWRATTALSTNFVADRANPSTKRHRLWTECGNNRGGNVLGAVLADPPASVGQRSGPSVIGNRASIGRSRLMPGSATRTASSFQSSVTSSTGVP